MKISLRAPSNTPNATLHRLATAAASTPAVHRLWLAQNAHERSALVAVSNLAQRHPNLRYGVGTIPCHASHPAAVAQDIASVIELTDADLWVGLGIGSRSERLELGVDAASPLQLAGQTVDDVRAWLTPEDPQASDRGAGPSRLWWTPSDPPPLLLGAIGPRMVELAGRKADGVIFSLGCSPNYLGDAVQTFRSSRNGDDGSCVAYTLFSGDVSESEHHEMMAPVVAHFLEVIVTSTRLMAMLTGSGLDQDELSTMLRRIRDGSPASQVIPPPLTNLLAVSARGLPERLALLDDRGIDEVALGFGGWNIDLSPSRLGIDSLPELRP